LKQRFYKALADRLYEGVKIRKEDVFVSFVEVPKENWSFGNGEAQYVAPPDDTVAGSGGKELPS
jgi:hypothetical protein